MNDSNELCKIINDFSNRLNYAFNSVPDKSSIGEICKILMIKACIRCWNVQVYSFLSDDNDARACASTVSENIFSFSCHSLYLLLMKKSFSENSPTESEQASKEKRAVRALISSRSAMEKQNLISAHRRTRLKNFFSIRREKIIQIRSFPECLSCLIAILT